MQLNIVDLFPLALTHPDLAFIATDAKKRDADPDAIIDHCPWDLSESYLGCCRRDLWRAVFHKERERLVVIAR